MSRIVLTMALDPALDGALCPGAVRCLLLVRSLAGRSRVLHTLTQSLATQLDRCTNTVRSYKDQLVAAGYLTWTTNVHTGISTIHVLDAVEPAQEGQGKRVEPPRPKDWRKGAQFSAAINQLKEIRAIHRSMASFGKRPTMPEIPVELQIAAFEAGGAAVDLLAARREAFARGQVRA